MAVPTFALFPNFNDLFKQLHEFAVELSDVDMSVEAGIVSEGEASAYANVWEWGNVRQTKKGPKTTWGINPDGQGAWLTIQAPHGYIRVHQTAYELIMMEEMYKVNFSLSKGREIDKQVKRAVDRISKKILRILQDTVPVDTEALKDSLRVYTMAEMLDVDED